MGLQPVRMIEKISVEEMEDAEKCIVKCVQWENFQSEFKSLKGKPGVVKKTSNLYRLDPITIGDIICVGGRIKNMPSEYDHLKHPWIIPNSTMWEVLLSGIFTSYMDILVKNTYCLQHEKDIGSFKHALQ